MMMTQQHRDLRLRLRPRRQNRPMLRARPRPICGVSCAPSAHVNSHLFGARELKGDHLLLAFPTRGEGFPSIARAIPGARLAFTPLRRCIACKVVPKHLSASKTMTCANTNTLQPPISGLRFDRFVQILCTDLHRLAQTCTDLHRLALFCIVSAQLNSKPWLLRAHEKRQNINAPKAPKREKPPDDDATVQTNQF